MRGGGSLRKGEVERTEREERNGKKHLKKNQRK